ncbi:hypothetical protein CGCA056_v010369 [Colletotrichum aenigma]|uniref:uncharacterized protein n=1 Tax=Colletotrichum aenigma TaxID=1215731 RepID=UPI001872F49C|nr:uncharacterized protein CGCA056_v010369 [Colletotrichum aenigma]KAF5517934.1 hypothetical protein CGCA056_v010369 [Colletotrichum aenigma]
MYGYPMSHSNARKPFLVGNKQKHTELGTLTLGGKNEVFLILAQGINQTHDGRERAPRPMPCEAWQTGRVRGSSIPKGHVKCLVRLSQSVVTGSKERVSLRRTCLPKEKLPHLLSEITSHNLITPEPPGSL